MEAVGVVNLGMVVEHIFEGALQHLVLQRRELRFLTADETLIDFAIDLFFRVRQRGIGVAADRGNVFGPVCRAFSACLGGYRRAVRYRRRRSAFCWPL